MTDKKLIVILGLDETKKPHAAKFDLAQAEAVRKAAGLMGFRTAIPKSEEAIALADRLVPGKLFAAGRGLVPFCKADAFERLVKLVELEPQATKDTASPAKPSAGPTETAESDPWASLTVGAKIIAPERNPAEDGWWPAVITAISKDGQKLTLRWLDNPKQPPVTLKRQTVALLSGG
jgi:hypothetical protein